jgi:anaerobic selenocysteine-containing dehydrogenase
MTTGLTKPLAGVGEDGRHLYTCPLCEAMCGLEIHVEDGRVTSIRGNRDDTWSHGHICPKGATLGAVHEDPDRIRRPMIKVDGQWQEVSWDAALRRCTELLAPVIEKYGIGAVTCYTGNPLAHSFFLGRYAGVLLGMSGIPISYSPGTVDQWPKNLSSHLMYGGWWSFPVPDIERTDLLIVMGANPAASQGSLLAAPDVMGIIGHFDTLGGSMFPRAAAWSVTVQPIPGLEDGAPEFGRYRTRVRGAKEVLGQVPVSCLAEEIATPGEGQIKALITVAGNPVLSTPAGHTLDEVLPTLDAMISVDLWLNETTRHADVILPAPSPLEQPHHDDLILNFAINSIANYSPPVFVPEDPDRPEEWEILIRLTGLCTGTPAEDVDVAAIDDAFFDYMAFTQGLDGATIRTHYDSVGLAGGPERILDFTLRTGPFGDRYGENPDGVTLEKLKAQPNGINFGPMVPQVPEILGTADGKIRLAPQYLLNDLPRLAERLDRAPDELVLVSRRHLRSNNSWLHNVGPLMKGKDRCTLLMHDDDATKRGVTTGDLVTVTSSGGQIEVPVEVTGAIMPGVVSMPHGWGHGKPGTRMAIANDSPGVNTNILSPPRFIDEPSGNGALNGIPVTVTPVAT